MNPVEPIPGEPLRFRVRSWRPVVGQESYLVDLESNNFCGACGCDQFAFRCLPQLKKNRGVITEQTRCKHILAAREWFLDKLLRDIAAVRGGAAAERRQERSGA